MHFGKCNQMSKSSTIIVSTIKSDYFVLHNYSYQREGGQCEHSPVFYLHHPPRQFRHLPAKCICRISDGTCQSS